MTYEDFNKTVYRLDSKHMMIVAETLSNVVRESAEETTSPRGVEPKLFVKEYSEDNWELRSWNRNGSSSLLEEFETEEAAELEWLNRTYEHDFLPSDWSNLWFDTEEEAIEDYVDMMEGEEEGVTVESVKEQLAQVLQDIEDDKQRHSKNLAVDIKKAYDQCQQLGKVTKDAVKKANKVMYSGYYYNADLYIYNTNIADEETVKLAEAILQYVRPHNAILRIGQ